MSYFSRTFNLPPKTTSTIDSASSSTHQKKEINAYFTFLFSVLIVLVVGGAFYGLTQFSISALFNIPPKTVSATPETEKVDIILKEDPSKVV